jgi:CDP-6-deoxy-D-xylo-4-hexulose-3-dehydrase
VMMAHTLGNPFDLGTVLEFCKRHDIWLIEDNCDALGCTYSMPLARAKALGFTSNSPGIHESGTHITRYTGTWGDLSTQSFYPPHHITMGEGGTVNIVHRPPLKAYIESFRDWGRDCWCASGVDNTCKKRFEWQLGELPVGYDHKYIYSHLGYNLKPLDIQAAIGRQQLKKLPGFVTARKENWNRLRCGLADLGEFFEFSLPTHATSWNNEGFSWDKSGATSDCSWFGFMLLVRPEARFSRTALVKFLDQKKIGNRMLFGGNLLRQPAFVQLKKDRPDSFRVCGKLEGADQLMNEALFLGTYPGLSPAMITHMIQSIRTFCGK